MNPQEEDTEWNDILRSKGILPPKELSDKELMEQAIEEAVEKFHLNEENKYEDYDLDELDELEDEEDEKVLAAYRQKRIDDMLNLQKKQKFGEVYHISKPEFIKEVTEASKESPVVIHLFKDSYIACRQLNNFLDQLALKYKATKFVKIISDLCIENYPDKNLPTLLIYDQTQVIYNRPSLANSSREGLKISLPELEKLLNSFDILSVDEEAERNRKDRVRIKRQGEEEGKNTIRQSKLSDDDEDYSDY